MTIVKESTNIMEESNYEEEDGMQMDSTNNTNNNETVMARISKSWTEHSAHVPSYSGGKVVLCQGRGARNLYGISNTQQQQQQQQVPFLLSPCMGDLTIMDALRGTKARTLRHGVSKLVTSLSLTKQGNNNDWNNDDDDEDEDDEGLDGDDIVSYALSPSNEADLVTVSRNSVLRHYNLSGTPNLSYVGEDGLGAAKIQKVIGKTGHKLSVSQMEFHCSGIFFATGSIGDGQVKVWDLRGGYATHSFLPLSGVRKTANRSTVSNLTWCNDVSKLWLAIGREDGTVYIHDLRDQQSQQKPLAIMSDHVSTVTSLAWTNPDIWDIFITAGRDAVIHTYQVVLEEQQNNNTNSRKKKKSKMEGTDDNKTKKQLVYKRLHTLPVYEQVEGLQLFSTRLLFNNFHQQVQKSDIIMITAGSKGILRIWKAATTTSIQDEEEESNEKQPQQKIISKFTCVGEQCASSAFGEERGGYMNLSLSKNHLNRQQEQQQHDNISDNHTNNIMSSLEQIVVTDAEQNISFYNLTLATTTSTDKKKHLTSSSDDEKVDGVLFTTSLDRTIVGHNDEILDLKTIPNNNNEDGDVGQEEQRIVVATNSAQVRIFTLGTFSCSILSGHTKIVLCLDVSPCGRYVCTAGKDQTMRLWDVSTGSCVSIAEGHTEAIGATALSRKLSRYDVSGKSAKNGAGAFAITASKDRTIKRWNLPGSSILSNISNDDNEPILQLSSFVSARAHEKDINIATVAPNDSLVATGSQDKTVKLWNSVDLTLKGTLRGHKRGVWDCQFSPFDRVLATASGDRTIKLWSLSDLSCVRTFQGHSASTLRVRFLSAGLQLLSSGADGLVKLWTIRNNECEATMDAHNDKVWALDVCPNGTEFVSGSSDSKIVVWKDTTIEQEDAKREEDERNILMEQKLANHLRFKEYEQALEIALDMDKPRHALKVLSAIIEEDTQKRNNTKNPTAITYTTLQQHVKSWPMTRVVQVLRFCRDWNTRARNSHVAMITVNAIVSSIPVSKLADTDGVAEILAGIIPYSERHFDRMDRLFASSFLIDFTLFSMGDLEDNLDEHDYAKWETNSKYVLPPKKIDGKVQIGGTDIVGFNEKTKKLYDDDNDEDDEIVTIGESDTSETGSSSSESDNDSDDGNSI